MRASEPFPGSVLTVVADRELLPRDEDDEDGNEKKEDEDEDKADYYYGTTTERMIFRNQIRREHAAVPSCRAVVAGPCRRRRPQ
jgi:hypothetical protein